MVPCLLDHGVAHIIIVAQEPAVALVVFAVIFVITLGIQRLSQLLVSPIITRRVHHTF